MLKAAVVISASPLSNDASKFILLGIESSTTPENWILFGPTIPFELRFTFAKFQVSNFSLSALSVVL